MQPPTPAAPRLSIVLNVMGRLELADYGFRCWMLQDVDEPYEVVLNLFNDQRPRYEALADVRVPNCRLVIREYERPAFFNISAANNLGVHASTGGHVLLANSDVVYPGRTARMILSELVDRDIHYAMLSRVNLTADETAALPPVDTFARSDDFDSFAALKGDSLWLSQGWLASRRALLGVGGFDANVLVAEDRDITARVTHYLARTGLQRTLLVAPGLKGYHLYHTSHELFNMMDPALAILEPRDARLAASPDGTDDVVPTRLDDLTSLVEDMRRTQRPPPMAKFRRKTGYKVYRRLRRATGVLLGIEKWERF